MVKLSLVTNDQLNVINKDVSFAYVVDSVSLWHNRLAHIDISTMKRMIKYGLISCNINEFIKCKLCVKSEMIKKPFKSVEKNTNLIDLIHSDICELNGMLTRKGNRYFITFIDDSSRYIYVYLLKHKNEAFNMFKIYKTEVENQLGKIGRAHV